jgi:hypothetical protein
VLVTIDVQDGLKVTEGTKAEEYGKAGLANHWIVGEHPFRPDGGIVARYTNQDGAFQLRDTVLLSELLAALPDGAA